MTFLLDRFTLTLGFGIPALSPATDAGPREALECADVSGARAESGTGAVEEVGTRIG